MRTLLAGVVLLVGSVGCGSSGGGGDEAGSFTPPPRETVNLIVQSPPFHSVWHLQYWQAVSGWTPVDPAKGFFVEHNSLVSIADLKPGTYDFAFDLDAGPFSGPEPKRLQAVEVEANENGDFVLVLTD